MQSTRSSLMAAAALMAMAAGFPSSHVQIAPAPRAVSREEQRKRVTPFEPSPSTRPFPRGPGWTHAQVQRMAKKARNRQRNRRAHR